MPIGLEKNGCNREERRQAISCEEEGFFTIVLN